MQKKTKTFKTKIVLCRAFKGALRKSLSFCRTMPPLATSETATLQLNAHDVTPSLKFRPESLLFILLYRIIEAIAVIREGLIQPIRQLFKHVWVRKTGIFNMKCCAMHL